MNHETTRIRVERLSKNFKLYAHPRDRLREWLRPGSCHHHAFKALENVSFTVASGECFGIIGPNGAGKSTLLKILTGALRPSRGSYQTSGRVLSLLELGTGFNPELSGRQNLFQSAALLGFPQGYVREKLPEIIAFADLGEFIERPVKHYSTGMYVRLAFAMFICMEPDILIIDEALSVGDIFFQQKCYRRIDEIIKQGTSCIFVSHDTGVIRRLCHRALLLKSGGVDFIGPAPECVSRYLALLSNMRPENTLDEPTPPNSPTSAAKVKETDIDPAVIRKDSLLPATSSHGARNLQLSAARVVNNTNKPSLSIESGSQLRFQLLLTARTKVPSPAAGIHLYDRLGNLIFAVGSRQAGPTLPDMTPGTSLIVEIKLTFIIAPGEYTFSLGVSSAPPGWNEARLEERYENLGPLTIFSPKNCSPDFFGMVRLPFAIDACQVQL